MMDMVGQREEEEERVPSPDWRRMLLFLPQHIPKNGCIIGWALDSLVIVAAVVPDEVSTQLFHVIII